jgi:hypothetical protein
MRSEILMQEKLGEICNKKTCKPMKQGIKPMFLTHLKRGGRFLGAKGMHF